MDIAQNLNSRLINNQLVRAIKSHDIINNNKLEKIRTLINRGADINAIENNPLCMSIARTKEDVAQLLLQQSNINVAQSRAFPLSIELLSRLIYGAEDNLENRSQISCMARIITEIIKHPNININEAYNNTGMTPLHLISIVTYPNQDAVKLLQSLAEYPNINLNATPRDINGRILLTAPINYSNHVYHSDQILSGKYQNLRRDPFSAIVTSTLINNGAVVYDPNDNSQYNNALIDGYIIANQQYIETIMGTLSPKGNHRNYLIFRDELEDFVNLYKGQFNNWSIDNIHERDLIAVLSDHYENNRTLLQEQFNNIISKGNQATEEDITELTKIYHRCHLGQSYRAALTVFNSSKALNGNSISTETGMPENQQQYNESLEQYKNETVLHHQNNVFYNTLKNKVKSIIPQIINQIVPEKIRGDQPALNKIYENTYNEQEVEEKVKNELVSYSFILDQVSNRLGIAPTDERFDNVAKELAEHMAIDHIITNQTPTTSLDNVNINPALPQARHIN